MSSSDSQQRLLKFPPGDSGFAWVSWLLRLEDCANWCWPDSIFPWNYKFSEIVFWIPRLSPENRPSWLRRWDRTTIGGPNHARTTWNRSTCHDPVFSRCGGNKEAIFQPVRHTGGEIHRESVRPIRNLWRNYRVRLLEIYRKFLRDFQSSIDHRTCREHGVFSLHLVGKTLHPLTPLPDDPR